MTDKIRFRSSVNERPVTSLDLRNLRLRLPDCVCHGIANPDRPDLGVNTVIGSLSGDDRLGALTSAKK